MYRAEQPGAGQQEGEERREGAGHIGKELVEVESKTGRLRMTGVRWGVVKSGFRNALPKWEMGFGTGLEVLGTWGMLSGDRRGVMVRWGLACWIFGGKLAKRAGDAGMFRA